MADQAEGAGAAPARDSDTDLLKVEIEALMAEPPKDLPSIVVVGDDHVFGLTPVK